MDAQNLPEPIRAANREAVRAAEQIVSDAWVSRLLLAESETQTVFDACTRARRRAADLLRAAQQAHDPDALVRARTALELADAAVGQTGEAHEHAAKRLADELKLWSERTARRLRQSQSDRSAIEGP